MRVAIIGGSGKLGGWLARFLLNEGNEVIITGRNEIKLQQAQRQLKVKATTDNITAIKDAEIILISVPIANFTTVIKQIGPYVQSQQIVIDLTSVKAFPIKLMHKYVTSGRVLGVHPLFGPGAGSIINKDFILTPTNQDEIELAQKCQQYLENRGARVNLMRPEEHDELMTIVLGLAHFIAIVSADTLLSLDKLRRIGTIGGTTFKLLLILAESVISEDPDLYASLQVNLPDIAKIERTFQKKANTWIELVEGQDQDQLARKIQTLKDSFVTISPDFNKAYHNMYRLLDRL
ncbi:MAG: prephenate dehydrogenase [Dehalococcoidales bacterium]|nr:prephenate dehydrogenase [Dehalococcoidales bacterium]